MQASLHKLQNVIWLILVKILLLSHNVIGATRSASVNSALHLECRDAHVIMVNGVTLSANQSRCSQTLRPDQHDFERVVRECSGRQACSNILVQEAARIPCGGGETVADELRVRYSCLPDFAMVDICHNTERTTSPFSGFLSSSNYPEFPDSLTEKRCSCEVTALSKDARMEFLLVDMHKNNQLTLSYGNMKPVPMCHNAVKGRCTNVLHTTGVRSVNLTFDLRASDTNIRFLLQFSAVNKKSRVRAVCHVSEGRETNPEIVTIQNQKISSTENQLEYFSSSLLLEWEVILGITAALAVLFILISIAILFACRYKRRVQSNNLSAGNPDLQFLSKSAKENLSYEIIPDGHQYESIRHIRTMGHVYNEPDEGRKYYEPCPGESRKENDYNDDGIYESIQNLNSDNADASKRFSKVSKSCSMPKYPAPPVPRTAPYNPKPSNRTLLSGEHNSESVHSVTYDVPPCRTPNHSLCVTSKGDDSISMESMPSLDMDFSDLLRETDRQFRYPRSNSSNDYLQPISIKQQNSN